MPYNPEYYRQNKEVYHRAIRKWRAKKKMKRPELLPITFEGSLYKLTEECGEVLQAIGKLQRHGIIAIDPKDSNIYYYNGKDLMAECEDLKHAIRETQRLFYLEEPIPQSGQPIK